MLRFQHAFRNLVRNMSYYAVARGHNVGVYDTWAKCEKEVKGFKGARYKKFATREDAEKFISSESASASTTEKSKTYDFSPKDLAVPLGSTSRLLLKQQLYVQTATPTETKVECTWPEDDDFEDDLADEDFVAIVETAEKGIKRKCEDNEQASSSASHSKIPKHQSKIWQPVDEVEIGGFEFQIDEEGYVLVYTDGSCLNNGQKGACAGFGVYFGDNHPLNTALPVRGRVTNNVGEIQASIHAIEVAKKVGIDKLCISTDSQFLINSITSWIFAWKRNDWKLKDGKPVKNAVDFKKLDELLRDDNLRVKWNYVKAHKGIKGNEEADRLARLGSDMHKVLNSK